MSITPSSELLSFRTAHTQNEFSIAKNLFIEYENSLAFRIDWQNFEDELKTVNTQYDAPTGALLLAYYDDLPVGCTGVRRLENQIAEIKRMYVQPEYRGLKIGFKLLELILDKAKTLGYLKVRLDSLRRMAPALRLYEYFGFYEISAYCYNPLEDAVFLEKEL